MLELQTLEINILWSQSREKAKIATKTYFRQTPVIYLNSSELVIVIAGAMFILSDSAVAVTVLHKGA
jgi:hypothetical protein